MADKEWENFCILRKACPKIDVNWYFGHTGVGKSWHCLFEFDPEISIDDKIVLGGDLNQYLKGYSGQPIVILNDIRPENIDFNYLLQLLDPYPMWVKTFGQISPWMAVKIYITAPTHPLEMFGRKWNV